VLITSRGSIIVPRTSSLARDSILSSSDGESRASPAAASWIVAYSASLSWEPEPGSSDWVIGVRSPPNRVTPSKSDTLSKTRNEDGTLAPPLQAKGAGATYLPYWTPLKKNRGHVRLKAFKWSRWNDPGCGRHAMLFIHHAF
jgi:hypothetical protein